MSLIEDVQAILRRWDPIGVEPDENIWTADEYDGYAPYIVSMVAQDCSVDQLSKHLEEIRTRRMGLKAHPERDAECAGEIISALRKDMI